MTIDDEAVDGVTPGPAAHSVESAVSVKDMVEDNVLQRVPDEQRRSGWSLSLNSMSAVTPLICIAIAGLVIMQAGFVVGVVAAVLITIFGTALAWLVGHITYTEGVSNTVATRLYGLGIRGSSLASAIFGFVTIGFLAIENVLLYNAIQFMFDLPDNWITDVIVYGILTILWIALTTFGMSAVTKTSGALLALSGVLIITLTLIGMTGSGMSIGDALSHGPLVDDAGSIRDRFEFALVTLVASTGAFSLTSADYARYAKSSKDVGISALLGALTLNVGLVLVASLLFYGGSRLVGTRLVEDGLASADTASSAAIELSSQNAGAFLILLSPVLGFILACAVQAKTQVLNVYGSSLALTNLADGLFRRRPSRFVMILVANAIGLIFVAGGILDMLNTWLAVLGVITTALIGVIIADFYVVRKRQRTDQSACEVVNWAGVVTVILSFAVAETLQQAGILPLGFLTSLIVSTILYPMLRKTVLRPGTWSKLEPVGLGGSA
ncbi:cytosine permease [Rhodococcus sp. T2V]|uniref:purine-cytosine permease family protein n=1 Tax=Rhodococcus sp. T2V TaxID=3034164 RepID=UPI0023E123A0|nr:cytosine permease [Rhodococcus sp. T2V]MDF3306431.1 cytosine permease [Rhodococcus sp. T2V]